MSRAQKKSERLVLLRKEFEALKNDLKEKSKSLNLFIKNIPAEVKDQDLKRIFSKYGELTSVKVKHLC